MNEAPVKHPLPGGYWPESRVDQIPRYKSQIVEMIRSGMFLSEIAAELSINTSTIRGWRKTDLEFGNLYAEAEEAAIDRLDREAHRRAFDGVADVVVHNGRVVLDPTDPEGKRPVVQRKYSDQLAMFILRGRRREVYGDRVETDNRHTLNLDGARESLAKKLDAIAQLSTAPAAGSQPD